MRKFYRIGTDTPDHAADDMSGTGASIMAGRWNRIGSHVTYAASSISLAILETISHFDVEGLPLNRYLVEISIEAKLWRNAIRLKARKLPVGWDAIPAGMVSQDVGEDWLKKANSAILIVPSAIVPEEDNILINPAHPDSKAIRVVKVRRVNYHTAIRPK